MKKIFFILFVFALGMQNTDAQFFKKAKDFLNQKNKGLTEKDAADGIRGSSYKRNGQQC